MKKVVPIVVTVLLFAMAGSAVAVPRLQTYIVDSRYYGYYRQEALSWVTRNSSFDLKVIGSWESAGTCGTYGGKGAPAYDYLDCYLMMSVPQNQSGTIWVNGIEITSFAPYASSVPSDISPSSTLGSHAPVANGNVQFLDIGRIDNNQMGAHVYSPFTGMFTPAWGDEALFDVVVRGYSWAHFDAVGTDSRGNTIVNSYCNDASYYAVNCNHYCATPEPGTLSLLGLGLLGMIPIIKRAKR